MDNDEFLIKLGHKVRILRNDKKLSQDGLANIANIEQAQISSIENGKGNPTVIYLKKIADALEVNIAEFFNFSI